MKQAAAGVIVFIDNGKSGAAYRAGNPFLPAKLLDEGSFTSAQGTMKGENAPVARLLPKALGGGIDIIKCELDFHAAKVNGKMQRGRYIISRWLPVGW
jgi:hypothetical protein